MGEKQKEEEKRNFLREMGEVKGVVRGQQSKDPQYGIRVDKAHERNIWGKIQESSAPVSQKVSQTPEESEVQRILGTKVTAQESNVEKRKLEAALSRREGPTKTIYSWFSWKIPHHQVCKVVYCPTCWQIQVEEGAKAWVPQ